MPEWVISWVLVAVSILLLRPTIRWLHKHIQGLGLLITNNPRGAMLIYYLLLVPGVFLHEGSQWIMSKILRVKIKKFRLWPEKQRSGVIRLGLVEIDGNTDVVRATLIGIVPLVVGIGAIALIGGRRFEPGALIDALATGDLPTIFAGLGVFLSAPDFWLWVYLVFAIANTMLPEEHDAINWWLIVGALVGLAIVLWILDLSILIKAGLDGPLAQMAASMSMALILSLCIDWTVMGLIWALERLLPRWLDREIEYQ
ncbi:MAG: hypothetical protein JXB07_04705 [Anaerolineae bacterium]|nr:hypothetical protein [Anaerolineae bacterium]